MMRRALILSLPLMAMACQPIQDSSRAAGNVVKEAGMTEYTFWRDIFTYHPPKPPQEPQTRYCYKMQSDIVCYDSIQPEQTAKLFGYQDGNQISWVQPGGGSLGASGGGAQGPRVNAGVQGAPSDYPMDTGSVSAVPIASGAIVVQDTPKITPKPASAVTANTKNGPVVVVPKPGTPVAAATPTTVAN